MQEKLIERRKEIKYKSGIKLLVEETRNLEVNKKRFGNKILE